VLRLLAAFAAISALLAGACADPRSGTPTITFPTEIPVQPSPEPTPGPTGACSLLREEAVEQVTGMEVQQVSATPLTCGFAYDNNTIVLTLQRGGAWEEFLPSLRASGPVQDVAGLGSRAVFSGATLGGVLMVQVATEVYLLSGTGDVGIATALMQTVLARLAEAPPPTP
jgi:hypothetical protein